MSIKNIKSEVKKTSCCGSYSTYHDEVLCCKSCWREVEIGEGDGTKYEEMSI